MASFAQFGPWPPASPVILSVPHAGRDYPQALRSALRVPLAALLPLEDRFVDRVASAARGLRTMLVQTAPRAWIDLNRSEDERDPRVDEGARPTALPIASPKLRSGLGLVPRRASGTAELWRRRFTEAEIAARIAEDHRPYHAALTRTLAAAHTRFGVAVLLDVHSMPPLGGASPPRIVIGDRFGRSAASRFVARIEAEAANAETPAALNSPYAGAHILDMHGRPADGIHAVQLEIDRSSYLGARLDQPGPGLPATVALLARIIAALEDEALAPLAQAAE